jgi:hypothetical protein
MKIPRAPVNTQKGTSHSRPLVRKPHDPVLHSQWYGTTGEPAPRRQSQGGAWQTTALQSSREWPNGQKTHFGNTVTEFALSSASRALTASAARGSQSRIENVVVFCKRLQVANKDPAQFLPTSVQKSWANFHQRALDVAMTEINRKTDLRVELESLERSAQRRVTTLSFSIKA